MPQMNNMARKSAKRFSAEAMRQIKRA
jgi:hypothetical protein